MENLLSTLAMVLNVNMFLLSPLSILFLGFGFLHWIRENDTSVLRFGVLVCGMTALLTIVNFVVLKLAGWHDEAISILQAAKEDGTSVPTGDLVSQGMLIFSSFWWVFALLSLLLVFIPLTFGHRGNSAQRPKS